MRKKARLAEVQSDPHYNLYDIPPEVEVAMQFGIKSGEELDAICKHFKCEYYELDEVKVYTYRKMMNQQK